MLIFFLLGGAFRAAGDARTPLRLGIGLTVLNATLNVVFIRGLGPVPAFGTAGAAIGTVAANAVVGGIGLWLVFNGRTVVRLSRGMRWRPDLTIVRSLLGLGLPAGVQGVAMNIAGVLLLRYIGSLRESAAAQAAYAVGYTELFSFITWSSVGLMGATATVAGQNLGAGRPDLSAEGARVAARFGVVLAAAIGLVFLAVPRQLFAAFGLVEPEVVDIGVGLLRYLSVSGLFATVALTYTGGLQGTGDTRSPLLISLVSQIVVPLGTCFATTLFRPLEPHDIWQAIVLGHITRSVLSVLRFRQGKWRTIRV
jgi:Na+-driven multidrug efflux pump